MTNPVKPPLAEQGAGPGADDLPVQLYEQWQDGRDPDARQLLRRAGPLTAAQVVAVLRVDQHERWHRGKALLAETYLQWCPELAGAPEAALELVYGEYVLREELGQAPAAAEYLRRFPQYAARLRQQVELRRALEAVADAPTVAVGKAPEGPGDETQSIRGTPRPPTSPPPAIAGYEILGELGRGGMGVVYKARHLKLKRLVALKMILAGEHAGARELARFRTEAEAVARLQHPNIVQIHEVGEQDGRPFFSLEFAPGGSLAGQLDGTPQPPRAAARLVETLARAVHAAHRQNVVHRDLKPANVLLAADGTPKVADFGLARQTDSTAGHTQEGSILGTPSYMPPEQAGGSSADMGPAVDVYALGAILYECLTGRPPFKAATPLETVMQVVAVEPVPPARLQPQVPRDLDTVCLKCLAKDPHKRYASAEALAEDLRRFQANEPILARPAGRRERLAKWARRHPGVAALTGLLLAVFATAFGLVTWKWHEAARAADLEHDAARQAGEREQAEKNAAAEANRRAEAERKAKDDVARGLEQSRQLGFIAQLWRATGRIDHDPVAALQALDDKRFCPPERRDFAWRYYYRLGSRLERRLAQQEGGIHGAAVTPNGRLLAALTVDGRIRLWDLATGEPGATLPGHGGTYQALAFSPDGKTLASGGADGLVKLWDVPAGKLRVTLTWQFPDKGVRHVMALAFHPGGRTLAAGGGFHDLVVAKKDSDSRWRKPVIWVWDVPGRTGKLLTGWPRLTGFRIEDNGVNSLAYAPDGKTLAVGLTRASSVVLLDAATGDERQRFRPETGWIGGVAFSPDGQTVACGNSTSNVFLYDPAARKVRRTLYGHLGHVGTVLFTADGTLITGATDGTVRLWETRTGRLRTTLRCRAGVQDVRPLPGGKKLLVITAREAQVWSLDVPAELATLRARRGSANELGSSAVAFNEEGTRLAVAGQDALVRVWDVAARKVVRDLTGHKGRTTAVAFGPAGSDLLASGGEDRKVLLWRLRGTNPLEPVPLEGHTGAVTCLAVTPDGALVVSGSLDGTVRLWDVRTGKLAETLATGHGRVHALALTGDGRRLFTGGQSGALRVWDVAERKLLETLPPWQDGRIDRLAVTRDGRRAATLRDGVVAFHDPGGKGKARPAGLGGALAVAFTPDGKTLVLGAGDRLVRLYDLASGQLEGELAGHSHQVVALAFNRDATLLASASRGSLRWDYSGEVKLWAAPVPEKDAAAPGGR